MVMRSLLMGSQFYSFSYEGIISSSGPIGGPKVVPLSNLPQEIQNHNNLVTCENHAIIQNTKSE